MQELSKRAKQGKFYYNPAKLRALEVLLRYFKSENILNSLPSNQYFQMILLCSKKVPESFYRFIDEEKVFSEIVNSDIYKLVDNISRRMWIQQVNCNCSKLLLPPDVKRMFEPTEKFTHWYYNDDKKTLGSMLHSKLYGLSSKGMKLDISKEVLKQLNLQEINVLKSNLMLSAEEIIRIQNSKRGKCLIYAGNNHIETKVVASSHEHQYITTDLKRN